MVCSNIAKKEQTMFLPELKSKYTEDVSILLQLDNHPHNYIIDCGEASKYSVKEFQDTKAIFISHTHFDHFINFDQVIRHQIGLGGQVVVCGPEGIAQNVAAKLKGYTWNLIDEKSTSYQIIEILPDNLTNVYELSPPNWELKQVNQSTPSEVVFSNDRFEVKATILDHKTPSVAYLFNENDSIQMNMHASPFQAGNWIQELKKAYKNNSGQKAIEIDGKSHLAQDLFYLLKIKKGDSFGAILDHAATPENHNKIKHLFQGCNRAFIECFYKSEEQGLAHKNAHSFVSASAKIMKESGIISPTPIHFSKKYSYTEVEEIKKEFFDIFNT